jgi:hypothetical protein
LIRHRNPIFKLVNLVRNSSRFRRTLSLAWIRFELYPSVDNNHRRINNYADRSFSRVSYISIAALNNTGSNLTCSGSSWHRTLLDTILFWA